eukprot:TRINITY_DN740_c6_g1_i2.p1 TRINITY_DN740_c6_g1~~TRINITY_DN740_c6_g1_i2.p1  ORF type:complete len:175 (-),score=68.12 TRINITY_DN740_c6_g1_i2:646-1170(-)
MSKIKSETKDSKLIEILKQLFAGGVAGTVAKSAVAPLERVKILYQVRSKDYGFNASNPTSVKPATINLVFSTLNKIFNNEGIYGLFKGNGMAVIRVFPYAAIQFAAFENYRRFANTTFGEIDGVINFACGSAAGATAVILTYPLDVARARLACQIESGSYLVTIIYGNTTLIRS